MTQLNDAELAARIRTIAMNRIESGLRVGGDYLVNMLQAIVSEPAAPDMSRPASSIPFLYIVDKGRGGRTVGRRSRKAETWQGASQFHRGGPPGERTGAGKRSIKFQIVNRDDQAGTITLRIGVDDSAPGGTHMQSYMMAHELGIRYPTIGPAKGMGAVIQHPWFRNGVRRYLPEVRQVVTDNLEGIEWHG